MPRASAILAFGIAVAVAACGSDDDDTFALGSASIVGGITVTDTRQAPARVSFVLTDAEGDAVAVELVFFEPGSGAPRPLSLLGSPSLAKLAAAPGGIVHEFQWDFAADLGSTAFREGFRVRADVLDGVQSIVSTASASGVALGNDAPTTSILSPFGSKQTGLVPVDFLIADSSDDVIDLTIEYDVLGDVPDTGFRPARPAGLAPGAPTPPVAIQGIVAPRTGALRSFAWDSRFDIGNKDRDTTLRVTADDRLLKGVSAVSSKVVIDNNVSAAVGKLALSDARESPATFDFELSDLEGDPQRVVLSFLRPGSSTFEPMTLVQPAPLDGLGASPGGTSHTRLWDFAADLGGAFREGLTVRVDVFELQTQVASSLKSGVAVGNDPPEVTEIVSLPIGEVSGDLDVTFRVADTSDDVVRIQVEYDVLGDAPDAGFVTARPSGLAQGDPTPTFAFQGLQADRTGVDLDFAWDTLGDEGALDFPVVLRFSIEDDLVAGNPFVTGVVDVDNNRAPRTEVNASVLAADFDSRRGIPIPFEVFDDEGDEVELFVQWRLANGTFPALPEKANEVRAALADPVSRRTLQIGTEYPIAFSGRILPVAPAHDSAGDKVRLPELADTASGALALGPEGLRLEILSREHRTEPTGNAWTLATPVAALPIGGGPRALVLDSEAAGSWRLREVDLFTGAELRAVATGTQGDPFAMDYQRDVGGRVILAVGNGTSWSVLAVELDVGTVSEHLPSTTTPVSGAVRAIASVDRSFAVLTVGDALVRVASEPNSALAPTVLLDGFATPWGVAVDPRHAERVFLADSGDGVAAGAVFEVDLQTRERARLAGPDDGFARPRALAVSADGTRLVACVDADPGDGTFEIIGITLGGSESVAPFELGARLVGGEGGLALGRDDLVVVALPALDDLAVGGGVEQVRRVAAFERPALIATVDAPFDPALTPDSRWRLGAPFGRMPASPTGTRALFAWDASDVARPATVIVRALALDTDLGLAVDSLTPRLVVAPLDVAPLGLGDAALLESVAIAIDDFDGDGTTDLVAADALTRDLVLFAQESPGAFRSNGTIPTGSGGAVTDLVAADLDGDGSRDLVVASTSDVRMLLRTGVLTFAPPFAVGTDGASAIVAADLDGDGRLDLALAERATDSVRVFFGARGGFGANPDVLLSSGLSGPRALAAADMTLDGHLDLIAANADSGEVSIFYQGAPGSFALLPSVVLPAPVAFAEPTAITVADLDGDGDRDVSVAYAVADVLAIHFQESPGGFGAGPLLLGGPSTTPAPIALTTADVDGDGDRDLLAAISRAGCVAVFLQQAPGEFDVVPDLVLGAPGSSTSGRDVVARDVDGDGRVDIMGACGRELAVFLQSRSGDFASQPALIVNPALPERARFVQPGDFDGDGDLDLAFANTADGHVSPHFQTAPGVFTPSPLGPVGIDSLEGVLGLAAGDLDGDGDVDLAAAVPPRNRVALLFQGSPGALKTDPAKGFLGSSASTLRPRSVAVADVDGDGDHDVVSTNDGVSTLTAFLQDAPGIFPAARSIPIGGPGPTRRPNRVIAADLDGDGDVDLASANLGGPVTGAGTGVTVFFRRPDGYPVTHDLFLGDILPSSLDRDVAAGDLDSDGDLDLVTANELGGALVIFEQKALGVFAFTGRKLVDHSASITPIAVRVADVDGDGDDDVLTVDAARNRVLVFVQDAPGSLRLDRRVELTAPGGGTATVSVATADLDMDGDLDIVAAESLGRAQTVYFGGR